MRIESPDFSPTPTFEPTFSLFLRFFPARSLFPVVSHARIPRRYRTTSGKKGRVYFCSGISRFLIASRYRNLFQTDFYTPLAIGHEYPAVPLRKSPPGAPRQPLVHAAQLAERRPLRDY